MCRFCFAGTSALCYRELHHGGVTVDLEDGAARGNVTLQLHEGVLAPMGESVSVRNFVLSPLQNYEVSKFFPAKDVRDV